MGNRLNIIILAAGKGTRIRSKLLKVLHPLAGRTVIDHVLDTAKALNPEKVFVVHGHQGEQLQEHLKNEDIHWVHQDNPQGTGHAVQLAIPEIDDEAQVLILVGDAPLIDVEDLKKLVEFPQAVLTAVVEDPTGYGRIIKNQDDLVIEIVEEKDANPLQKQVTEITSGILLANAANMKRWLKQIDSNNAQNELYLTDALALAHYLILI